MQLQAMTTLEAKDRGSDARAKEWQHRRPQSPARHLSSLCPSLPHLLLKALH